MAKKKAPSESAVQALARAAVLDSAPEDQVGSAHPVETADGIHTVRFDSLLSGYPGWQWVVTLTDGDGGELGVMELHLLPGPDALVAPDWVPWEERLEEYRRHEADGAVDDDESIDESDLAEGDIDGVDIDQLDLDPASLEVPDEPNDVFDHIDQEN